jgi:CheY-like chemotaxis protein
VARVLVVDEDLVLLSLVTDVLENADHVVSKARSGSEGLRLLRSSDRFDLLIADVGVDDASGVRLIQKARTERPDLRVMAMSEFDGNESVSLRQSLRRLGVVQVLRKPFATQVLVQAVSSLLGERR